MYAPIKLKFSDFDLGKEQRDTLVQLAKELKIIKKNSVLIKDTVARGGFVLDTILGVKPNDIDLFYSLMKWQTENWQGCQCDEIRSDISKLKLPLTSSRKIDLGHILEGEIYFDPIPKIIGYFSHHIDIPSMICLDSEKNIWTCSEAVDCMKNRIYEIRNEGRIQHAYYPYSENPYYRNYLTGSARTIFRGLRMVHTKKYRSVGPAFKELLQNAVPILDTVLKNQKYTQAVRDNISEKNGFMKKEDYLKALQISGVSNYMKINKQIRKLMDS